VVPEDGRALEVRTHELNKNGLQVRVTLFSRLSSKTTSELREEVAGLGRFLGLPDVRT
jgi:hypothetical protein